MFKPRPLHSVATACASTAPALWLLSTCLLAAPYVASAAAQPLTGLSVEDAREALTGKNYVMQSDSDGAVQSVVVSGENGSGQNAHLAALPEWIAQSTADSGMPQKPRVQLKENLQGQAAIEALGAELAAVAAAHGWSTDRLKEILLTDSSAWIDTSGRVYYVEEAQTKPLPEKATGAVAPLKAGAAEPLDLAKTFLLHSKPGSNRVIYLDFNGHTVAGTAWNTSYGLSQINAPAFDLDGNASAFNDTELARIQAIWQRVSEDYAPFDVDVTTEEPAAAALDRSSAGDLAYGTRAVITRSVLNCGCGGVAYVGAFDFASTAYKPAWVFYDALGNGHEKYVAEAISHEVGHNLGLSHDGTSTVAYYQGHGAGTAGWAPIMGVGYYRELTQWSRGEYPGANNKEDDFAIIQSHGAVVQPDEAGDSTATAAPLGSGSAGTFQVSKAGTIQRQTDVDYYVFATAGGQFSLAVAPAVSGANLDLGIALYASNGALIASANPATTLDASLAASLAAGTYYLRIDGTGKSASGSDYGYSDYGSLGRYKITGSYTAGTAQAPTAVITASPATGVAPLPVGFSSSGSKDDGTLVAYSWNFGDGTAASSEPNPQHTFTAAGTYTVTLTVRDDQGLTGSATTQVTVTAPVVATTLRVSQMALQMVGTRTNTWAYAYVVVLDGKGQAVPSATVQGKWTGMATANVSGVTNASGIATLASPVSSATKGTFTFTVTGITRSGYTYAPGTNSLSSISISR
ncbi:PKD domain-containing protein [Methyloterricola oryzae]|uniref:PKD domain-containing protein n=1 Tax=Methyloterricola oryzae TaxID=1495050 RepID=UPI00069A052A|nr:PKD domain-containing protein [Methyloterricola oryzae]